MDIPMPAPREKAMSIAFIKAQGAVQKKTLTGAVKDLFTFFGIRNIFAGVTDCVFIALICAAVLFILCLPIAVGSNLVYAMLFTISPVFYILVHLISLWKEHILGTLDIQKSCKYTPLHLTIYRMMAFGLISVLLYLPILSLTRLYITTGGQFYSTGQFYDGAEASFLQLLLTAMCPLLFYAVLLLFVILRTSSVVAHTALPLTWIAIVLPAVLFAGKKLEMLLSGLSILSFSVFVGAALMLFLVELRILLRRGEGRFSC